MLSTTEHRAEYIGTGTIGPFGYGFPILAATDLLVISRDATSGLETLLTYLTDYTVDGVGNKTGGTITLTQPLLGGNVLSMDRRRPLTQLTSLRQLSTFDPATIETAFDHQMMVLQQVNDAAMRAVRLKDSEDPDTFDMTLPEPEPAAAIVWNALGTGFDNAALSDAQLSAWSAAQNQRRDTFVSGTDFTAGVTTSLTLSADPGSLSNVAIARRTSGVDAIYLSDEFSVLDGVITFVAAIPTGTTRVEVTYFYTYQINTADANNVRLTLGNGRTGRSLTEYLRDNGGFNVKDYRAIGDSLSDDRASFAQTDTTAAALGHGVAVPAGVYRFASDFAFTTGLVLDHGAILAPDAGVTITIPGAVMADLSQHFGTAGTVLLTGDVYPQWFGTVADRPLGTFTVATSRADTLGFRKACKSLATEFVKQQASRLLFRTIVPSGFYQLGNGFTVPFGQALIGSGTGTTKLQVADSLADPLEPQLAICTVGPVITGSGGGITLTATNAVLGDQPSSLIENFFLISDSGSRKLLWLSQIAGVHVSKLFTSSGAIHVQVDASDVVMSDIFCDQGLSQIVLNQANNVQITNLLTFAGTYQVNITGPSRDVTINNWRTEYAQFASMAVTGQNCVNINVNGIQIIGNTQYGSYQGAFYVGDINNEVIVRNGVVRNIPGPFVASARAGVSFTAVDILLDQTKTNPAYTQGTVMSALSGDFLNVVFRNVDLLNLAVTPIALGINTGSFKWYGGRQAGGTYSGRTINALTPTTSVLIDGVDGGNKPLSVMGASLTCNRLRNRHIQADLGDADVTLDSLTDGETQQVLTSLTANRTITFATANSVRGDRFTVIRLAGGAFSLSIGGLVTFGSGVQGSMTGEFDGTAWRLLAKSIF